METEAEISLLKENLVQNILLVKRRLKIGLWVEYFFHIYFIFLFLFNLSSILSSSFSLSRSCCLISVCFHSHYITHPLYSLSLYNYIYACFLIGLLIPAVFSILSHTIIALIFVWILTQGSHPHLLLLYFEIHQINE